jgi:hypothetical protein
MMLKFFQNTVNCTHSSTFPSVVSLQNVDLVDWKSSNVDCKASNSRIDLVSLSSNWHF